MADFDNCALRAPSATAVAETTAPIFARGDRVRLKNSPWSEDKGHIKARPTWKRPRAVGGKQKKLGWWYVVGLDLPPHLKTWEIEVYETGIEAFDDATAVAAQRDSAEPTKTGAA